MNTAYITLLWIVTVGIAMIPLKNKYIGNFYEIFLVFYISTMFLYLSTLEFNFNILILFLAGLAVTLAVAALTPEQKSSRLHPKYMLIKLWDVFFQQSAVMAIFLSLSQSHDVFETILIGFITFFVIHLPLFIIFPWQRALFFLTAVTIFGPMFFFALHVDIFWGFVFNMIFHYGCYTLLAFATSRKSVNWLGVQ